jgi:hypothetical protein
MSVHNNPTGRNPALNTSTDGTNTPTKFERFKTVAGDGISSLSSAVSNVTEWTPVKTVRNSAPWYYLTLPVSLLGSFFSGIWARISKAIWGAPSVVTAEVTLESKGWLWNSTYTMPTESALRDGYMTVEEGIASNKFTQDDAKIKGWVQVEIPGRVFGSSKMMLKDAILGGYMTVEKAITDGHITESQASQSDWVKKETK